MASTKVTVDVPPSPSMENPDERNLLRQAELVDKYRDLIVKSAKWLELERVRELERTARAQRDAAAGEQNLWNSHENERAMKNRLAIRQQRKAARKASRRAVNALKKTVEIGDGPSDCPLLMDATGSSSRNVFERVTGLQLVEETQDDVREFLQSIS